MTIGRGADNRIVVHDDRCSRRHCDLYETDNCWHVRDLNSRNGTSVNGVKIARNYPVSDGDVIRLGACELLFTTDLSRPLARFLGEEASDTDAETDGAVLATRSIPVPIRRTAKVVLAVVIPAPTPVDTLRARLGTLRIRLASGGIFTVPIPTPFPYIPVRIVKPKIIRPFSSYWISFRTGIVFIPTHIIERSTSAIRPLCTRSASVLPLCFGWQC